MEEESEKCYIIYQKICKSAPIEDGFLENTTLGIIRADDLDKLIKKLNGKSLKLGEEHLIYIPEEKFPIIDPVADQPNGKKEGTLEDRAYWEVPGIDLVIYYNAEETNSFLYVRHKIGEKFIFVGASPIQLIKM